MRWMDWISQNFRKPAEAHEGGEAAPEPSEKILRWVETTQDEDLTCEDVLDQIAQFAELDLAGEDATRLLPLVETHLKLCSECHDEYEALVRVLRGNV